MGSPNHKPDCLHCGKCPMCHQGQFPWRYTAIRLLQQGIDRKQCKVILLAMLDAYNKSLGCRNKWHKR